MVLLGLRIHILELCSVSFRSVHLSRPTNKSYVGASISTVSAVFFNSLSFFLLGSMPLHVAASTGVPPVCSGPHFQPTAGRSTVWAHTVLIAVGDFSVKMATLTTSGNVPLDVVSNVRTPLLPLNSSVRARSLVCAQINL